MKTENPYWNGIKIELIGEEETLYNKEWLKARILEGWRKGEEIHVSKSDYWYYAIEPKEAEEIKKRILDKVEENDPAMAGELADRSLLYVAGEISCYDGVDLEDVIASFLKPEPKNGAEK